MTNNGEITLRKNPNGKDKADNSAAMALMRDNTVSNKVTLTRSKAVNKLGVLLNQAVREKIFQDEVRKDTQKELYEALERLTAENIKLKINKPGAPIKYHFEKCGVEVKLSREEFYCL